MKYWYIVHLPLASKVLVINSILASFLWFFLSVWASSKKVIQRCKIILHNYLWVGKELNTRMRMK